MDPTSGWCTGCLRTLAEIAAWSVFEDHERRAVWAALPLRRGALAKNNEEAARSRRIAQGSETSVDFLANNKPVTIRGDGDR